uniref:Uncharacterized protein n=1 Tax=Arundo donax TaxID=35708 RepID=A0A0A8XRZ3_ARUDO
MAFPLIVDCIIFLLPNWQHLIRMNMVISVLSLNLHSRTLAPYLLLYLYHHHHVLHGCVVMIAKNGAAYLLNWQMSLEKQIADGLVRTMETRRLLTVLFHK